MRSGLYRRWIRLTHRGHEVRCPCCEREYAAFAADRNRPDAICPGCGSHERHRALWLYLQRVLEGIEDMPFDDASFDGVVCSHVLEHVDDDGAAMAELCRVLRPDGWAVVLVPLDLNRTETYEDPEVVTPEQRERAYWQDDHMRLYALDIADRLQEAGFGVETVRMADTLPAGAVRRHGLLPEEVVFRCNQPPLVQP